MRNHTYFSSTSNIALRRWAKFFFGGIFIYFSLFYMNGVSAASQSMVVTGTSSPGVFVISTPNGQTLSVGEQVQAMAGVISQGSNTPVAVTAVWTSSNSGVATVDAGGTITGVAPGTVLIIATANGVSRKMVLVVK